MAHRMKRFCSVFLAALTMVSLSCSSIAQAATTSSEVGNELSGKRTNITFLEGKLGDSHVVYTYQQNGQKFKVEENATNDRVISIFYAMDSAGNYVEMETKTLVLGNEQMTLHTVEANGKAETEILQESVTFSEEVSYHSCYARYPHNSCLY